MKNIKSIKEERKVFIYLKKRRLEKQYKKAKNYILSGNLQNADLKTRQPKKDQIYYFKINKQFRVLAKLYGDILVVFDINNHQE